MPTYNYLCSQCGTVYEIWHSMACEDEYECPNCEMILQKQLSSSFYVSQGIKPTLEDRKEEEHNKKVKDKERAVRSRKKHFGSSEVGKIVDKPDPKHLVRGRVLGGQEKEIDKQEFIKAAAKSSQLVKVAQDALKKAKK